MDERIRAYEKKIVELNAQIDATQMQLKASERIRELATSSQINEVKVEDAEFQKIQEMAKKSLSASRAPRGSGRAPGAAERTTRQRNYENAHNLSASAESSDDSDSSDKNAQNEQNDQLE